MSEQARTNAEFDLLSRLAHDDMAHLAPAPGSLGLSLAPSLTARSTEPLVSTLAELCTAHPTRSKWIVLSSRTLGLTLSERLAREGTSWLNLRFTTPWDLALRTAAPWLVEQGLDPTPEDLGAALVMRLLRELPAGTPEYFRKNGLADHPAIGSALWRAIRELRLKEEP